MKTDLTVMKKIILLFSLIWVIRDDRTRQGKMYHYEKNPSLNEQLHLWRLNSISLTFSLCKYSLTFWRNWICSSTHKISFFTIICEWISRILNLMWNQIDLIYNENLFFEKNYFFFEKKISLHFKLPRYLLDIKIYYTQRC